MKVLTKYFKVILCFMAFALCSFMFAFTPTLTAIDAAEMAITGYNVAINALKMPNEEVDYNTPGKDVFRIPLLENSGLQATATKCTIRVVDPSGYPHDYVVDGTENDTNYFTKDGNDLIVRAKNDGDYKVIYIVEEGGKTYYSNTYRVSVTNISYELDFSTPVLKTGTDEIIGSNKNLVKRKLPVSTTPYELPVAYAKAVGEELEVVDGVVDAPVADIRVTKDGAPQKENETGSIFTSHGGKYYITPSEAGVYTIEYSYNNSVNRPTKTFTITVEENFVPENLKLASTPTMPSIELGKEITLPKLTVNAGKDTNVDVNIKSIVVEKETDSTIKCVLENNNVEFSMTPDMFDDNYTGTLTYADMVGNYRITYLLEDAYGKTLTETFKVDGVTVSSKPVIKLSYNYDKTQDNFKDSVVLGAETELKAEYISNKEIVLPAVYVEDAVTTNYDDFIIIRTIRKGSTYYYIDNKKYDEATDTLVDVEPDQNGYNASEDPNIGNVGKEVKFKFKDDVTSPEGTYYLEYRVISKVVKERESYLYANGTTEKYTFKVVAAEHEDKAPKVEITNLKDSYVKNTDKIVVKVNSTDEYDTRLKNAVFMYTSKKAAATESLLYYIQKASDDVKNSTGYEKTSHIYNDSRFETEMQKYFEGFVLVKESEETKNSFALNLTDRTEQVNVVAVAVNDDGMLDIDEKVLTIKDTTNDNLAPTIVIDEVQDIWKDGSNVKHFTIGQSKEVKLPVVHVKDKDKTLTLNVAYYIGSPENSYGAISYLSPTGKKFYYETVAGEEVQVIDGGTITTSKTGVYYVAYSATDVAGNTSVMYFTFEVVDTSKPVLTVEPVGEDLTQTGNTVEAGKGAVIDFETTLRSADGENDYTSDKNITITIDDNNQGLDYQLSGNSRTSYKFNDYGTYVITVTGKHTKEVNGQPIELVSDSKVIKVNIVKKAIEWLGEFDVPQHATKGETIKLPDVYASNDAVVKVTYIVPGSSESEAKEATKATENGYSYWTFKASDTAKGTYTVIYTATNDEDTLTKKISIKVGDNVAPTLNFNKGKLTQDLVYDGKNDIEYVVEMVKSSKKFVVKAINNGKEVYSYDIGLVITDKDDTGTVNSNMSWSNLSYELTGDHVTKGETTSTTTQYLISGTGKYQLKLTIKDSYDNTRTESIEFNVVTKASVKTNKDNVVGAVLIVVSLVLLAGVILFFTFTGKKGGKSTPKAKKEKAVKTSSKVEKAKEEVVEAKEEVEEVKEEAEEAVEETKETESETEDEAKTGEVE